MKSTTEALSRGTVIGAWLRLLRPQQWVKNAFVLTPLVFSGRFTDLRSVEQALAAFVAFCLVASGVYAGNDVVDRHADRAHPTKRHRPVAAGLIPVGGALAVALTCVGLALAIALAVHPALAAIIATYLGLNVLYTLWLKRVVLLDVFTIAAFFVLRLLAGATAIAVTPSIWLLLCGGLLALYLGFAKRRNELVMLEDAGSHRRILQEYTVGLLDQLITIVTAATLMAYMLYTFFSPTGKERPWLMATIPFVIYGIFRFLYLMHRHGKGGDPSSELIEDRNLLVCALLFGLTAAAVMLLGR